MLRSVVQPFLLFFNQEVVMESFPLVRERFYPAWVMALAAAAVFGRLLLDGGTAGAFVLWLLGVLMGFSALREAVPRPFRYDSAAAWSLLALGVAAAFYSPAVPAVWALWLGVCALCAYSGGIYMLLRLALPSFLLVVVAPSAGFLYLLLSFPLSRLCTVLTVGCCGFPASIAASNRRSSSSAGTGLRSRRPAAASNCWRPCCCSAG